MAHNDLDEQNKIVSDLNCSATPLKGRARGGCGRREGRREGGTAECLSALLRSAAKDASFKLCEQSADNGCEGAILARQGDAAEMALRNGGTTLGDSIRV